MQRIINDDPSDDFKHEYNMKVIKDFISSLEECEGLLFISSCNSKKDDLVKCSLIADGVNQVVIYKTLIEKIIPELEEQFKKYEKADMVKFVNEEVKFPENHFLKK